MTRRYLRFISGILIGVLLFAQMAVAAYACPGESLSAKTQKLTSEVAKTSPEASRQSAVSKQESPCESMGDKSVTGHLDLHNANLCAEHCKYGQQSDHVSTLTVPPAMMTVLYFSLFAPEATGKSLPVTATCNSPEAAFPPHAILHCCFRI